MTKRFFGLGLVLVAVALLFQNQLGLGELSGAQLISALIFMVLALRGLFKKDLPISLLFGGLSFTVLNSAYRWLSLPTWTLVLVIFLFSWGISILLQPKHSFRIHKTIVSDKDVAFGDSSFYVNDADFTSASYDVAFGNAKIYFDNAQILGDTAEVKINIAFGHIYLYVPKNWRVVSTVETAFGTAKILQSPIETDKTLRIRGDVSFASLEVIYI